MKPVEIADGIFDVGAIDWNIRDFHGYSTERGTSYNAFLVVDEKVVLIDAVKAEFTGRLIENIASVIDPKKIDIIISNHTEMDHSGALPRIMREIGDQTPLYCSKMGFKNLKRHFPPYPWNYHAVEPGEELSIGKRTLSFMETRMLHWPDSMFTCAKEDGILFSSDAFGQHYAGVEEFEDEVGDAIMFQAKKYFANILLPFAPRLAKLIGEVSASRMPIRMICPDHGALWRREPGKIISAYAGWCEQRPTGKAVIIYDTMWHSTEKMADALTAALSAEGIAVKPIHIRSSHRSDIMTEVMDASAVIVGSPTLNNNLFPTVADVLMYMRGLKPKNKIGAAFGSYGWSGEAVKQITDALSAMSFDMVAEGPRALYVPDGDDLGACRELAVAVAERIRRAIA